MVQSVFSENQKDHLLFKVFLLLCKQSLHGCLKLDAKMDVGIQSPHNFLSVPAPPTPVGVMVAGMCMMVGLKGQALVIVPWSWLSDTTACLLFTPGTPCLIDSSSCTHHPHPLLGAIEGCNSNTISLFYCLLYCVKMCFSAGQGFLCKVKHYFCGAVIRCDQKGCCWEAGGQKLVSVVFFCQFPTTS